MPVKLTPLLESTNSELIQITDLKYLDDAELSYYHLINNYINDVGYIQLDETLAFDHYNYLEEYISNDSVYLGYIKLTERGLLREVLSEIKSNFQVSHICAESRTELIPLWEHVGAVFFKENNNYVVYEHRDEMHPFII